MPTRRASQLNRRPIPADGEGARPAAGGPTAGRVTKLSPQTHDAERLNVFLDGTFAFGLHQDVALREGLAVGDVLDAARVTALRDADESAKATTAALAFLAYRPRSEREVRDRLRQKGYAPEAVDAAVARLEGWRYLDDADFARRWVENREAHQPRGRRLLEQELQRKGIDRETARATIDDAELDEAAAAVELARAKLRSYAGQEPVVVRRRLAAFLARRGYGWDVVRPALDRLLGDGDETGADDPGDAAQ